MRVISIGTDRKIFEEDSAVRQRQIEYGRFFERLDIIVFSKKNPQLIISSLRISDNVFVHPTNSKNKLFYIYNTLKIVKEIIGNLKDNNFILTCQDPFETGLVGTLIKLFFNLPLHIQVHTDLMHKYFRSLSILNTLRFFVSEFILRYADRVRIVSERVKKSIEPFVKNIDVLPIKTEVKNYVGGEIKKPFLFTLLMVCRLEKEKNIKTALQAVKNLEDNNVGICIVGDGSQREKLERMVKDLNIGNKVVFAGWQNDLAPYYKMADVFVSASFYEGYGVSTVEAACFEKPLILSETGVAGDVFKENESAFICDAKDTACFTGNILKIYKDKDLAQKMGQSAKLSANRHLSSEKNYFDEYASSILKTANNFKKRNFIVRIFYFKKVVFNSFRVLRYLICGVAAATVNIGSLFIFTDIAGIWYLYSSILAFFISLVMSFVLQKFVVFKDMKTGKMHRDFMKFFISAVLSVTTNTILVYFFTDIVGVWYILSQIIAGFFVMIQNFTFYKFFIFNK
jgi:glycosyltransferase involved in cell wall biosynthesis/putative flippase GtrA